MLRDGRRGDPQDLGQLVDSKRAFLLEQIDNPDMGLNARELEEFGLFDFVYFHYPV